jgi:hypothetical protein
MSRFSLSLLANLVLLGAPAVALAAGPQFEVTPWAGYRIGGEFETGQQGGDPAGRTDVRDGNGWGIDLGLYRDATSYYQVFYARRDAGLQTMDEALRGTDIRIEYAHFGGTLLFPQARGYTGYVSATVGLTRMSARTSGYDPERKFSASLGGGVRLPLTERLHASFGARGYATFVSSESNLVCISDAGEAGCLLRSSGRTVWEAEAQAGLTFQF